MDFFSRIISFGEKLGRRKSVTDPSSECIKRRQVKEMKEKLHFKYIIVDEYQDISRQRFDLTTVSGSSSNIQR